MKFFLLLVLIGLSYAQAQRSSLFSRSSGSFDDQWDDFHKMLDNPGTSSEDIFERLRKMHEIPDSPSGRLFEKQSNEDFKRPYPRRDSFPKRDSLPRRDSNPTPQSDDKPTPDVSFNKKDCSCRLRTTSRIVNGQVVAPNSIPWQVSLASWGQHFCGASVINNQYILTAAHCIDTKSAPEVEVRVGLHHLDDSDIKSKTYSVEKIISHHYTTPSEAGDIAILKLKKPLEFTKGQVEPACFNTVAKEYPDQLMASGWGTTSTSIQHTNGKLVTGDVSPVLKQAYFKEDKSRCENYLICINSDVRDSVCQGDSGGPLHHTENGKTTVDGVASFVTGVGRRGGPVEMCTGAGAYSRLSYYKEWFENIVGDNYCTL